jgi:RIO kinase 1
MTNHPI